MHTRSPLPTPLALSALAGEGMAADPLVAARHFHAAQSAGAAVPTDQLAFCYSRLTGVGEADLHDAAIELTSAAAAAATAARMGGGAQQAANTAALHHTLGRILVRIPPDPGASPQRPKKTKSGTASKANKPGEEVSTNKQPSDRSMQGIFRSFSRWEEAVRWWQPAADAGHPAAVHDMAVCHLHGLGVQQNKAEAHRLFELAAAGNLRSPDAMFAVGVEQLARSESDQAGRDRGLQLLEDAAARGNVLAQSKLGRMLLFADSVRAVSRAVRVCSCARNAGAGAPGEGDC